MKMFNLNCPHCGKYFYCEMSLFDMKVPVHCPQCDVFIPFDEYKTLVNQGGGTALARLRVPLTAENMDKIIYTPKSK